MINSIQKRIEELVDIAGVILIVLNRDQTVAFINKKGRDAVGYTAEEIIGKNYFDTFIEEHRRVELKIVFNEIIEGNLSGSATYENFIVTKSGELRLIKWTNSYLRDKQGSIIASVSSGEDITELRRVEAFTNAINERIADIVVVNDAEGVITYASHSTAKQLGFYPQELVGKKMIDFVHPEDRQQVMDRFFEMVESPGRLVFSRHRIRTANGDYIWIEGEARNMIADPNIRGFLNNFREIGERLALEERFRVLFEQSMNPIMIVGFKGIIECNAAAVTILKAKNRGDLIGRMPSTFSPLYQEDGMLSSEKAALVNKKAKEQGSNRFEWLHQDLDGYTFPVEVTVSSLPSLGKDISLVSWFDLTERKRFEKELKDARKKAEQASKAQEQFLSVMSHEIRTPLNAIIGFSNLLIEEDPRPDQKESLETLQFSSQHLMALINDILDYSKIQADGIELEHETFSLDRLLQGILHSFKAMIKNKNLKLELVKEDAVPGSVIGDQVRLAQVLTNLIGNAIKFTEKGSVLLEVKRDKDAPDPSSILFSIKDTGIGIAAEKLTSIFDQFTQASNDTTRRYGGTGLGLSISKKLVSLMGGDLSVNSTLSVGSNFYFSIPFGIAQPDETQKSGEEDPNTFSPLLLNTLLVEDNTINQLVIRKTLERWSVTIDIADNGFAALEKIKRKDYDVVLMDLQMPGIDGFETTRMMRSEGFDKPIIALTATVLFDVKQKALQSGMNDIIGKPFRPKELYQKLKEAVSR